MSMISLELTGNAGPESKRYKMKQFVDAAKEYSKTRSDSTAILMNRHLQVRLCTDITQCCIVYSFLLDSALQITF